MNKIFILAFLATIAVASAQWGQLPMVGPIIDSEMGLIHGLPFVGGVMPMVPVVGSGASSGAQSGASSGASSGAGSKLPVWPVGGSSSSSRSSSASSSRSSSSSSS